MRSLPVASRRFPVACRGLALQLSSGTHHPAPQTLLNDLENGTCPGDEVVCLVVDEAHKAVGNAACRQVVDVLFRKSGGFRILGLSATPGQTSQQIQQVRVRGGRPRREVVRRRVGGGSVVSRGGGRWRALGVRRMIEMPSRTPSDRPPRHCNPRASRAARRAGDVQPAYHEAGGPRRDECRCGRLLPPAQDANLQDGAAGGVHHGT